MVTAILIAISLTILNAVSSILIIRYAMKKDWDKLFNLVFGSMIVRYFLTAAIVWLCLTVLDLHKLGFALTFLISTFILLFIEIVYLHERTKALKRNKINSLK